MPRLLAAVLVILGFAAAATARPVTFEVSLDGAKAGEGAVSGRLVVYLIREGAKLRPNASPANAPFYDDPQPLFGVDVAGLEPTGAVTVDDRATAFPAPLSQLPSGRYRAQAVLDTQRLRGSWFSEAGNFYSEPVAFEVKADEGPQVVRLSLAQRTNEPAIPAIPGATELCVRSELLSAFYGREVSLRAMVISPSNYDPNRRYPAIYEVPGFGGDHRVALRRLGMRGRNLLTTEGRALHEAAFFIGLDPDSPNGHTLFADSANNGPWARALVEELIPALEGAYPLIDAPSARIVTGHSSGGWTAIWLAMQHPQVFGHAFAGSPDPVDFSRFQKADFYHDANLYNDATGAEVASNHKNGATLMTVREENLTEEVIGPRNSSGQQWDSWQAVFGPRDPTDGRPVALFDPHTGAIDADVARQYEAYDITAIVRREPERYGPIFQRSIRILVGGADEWNLHEAVARLRDQLAASGYPVGADPLAGGAITIIPGRDHVSIFATPEARARDSHMLELLRRAGHVPAAAP